MEPSDHVDHDGWYAKFSATGAYQHNWQQGGKANALGSFPFWSQTNIMSVGVNSVATNLDAYQFGLGNVTTTGSINIDPNIYQSGADFMLIFGSSANESGFFAKIKAPVSVYNIDLQFEETTKATAAVYPAGALELTATTTADPATSMAQAFAGKQTQQGNYSPMTFGLIDGDQSTGAKFGDIEITIGYNYMSDDDNSCSIALRASGPAGNKATGVYMLEPIVGRGGNWGVGGYLATHVNLWHGNKDNRIVCKFMGNVLHLLKTTTVRSYDLSENGIGSKYLLVANYDNGIYQNEIRNLINHTTLESKSSFVAEGDAAISFAYVIRNWSIDAGYELFGRSQEQLEINDGFEDQKYAILGRQGVGTGVDGVNVNAAQPLARINLSNSTVATTAPALGTFATNQTIVTNATDATSRILTTDLNVLGASQSSYITNKIFSKATYEWIESDFCPHLGFMGEFEFSMSENSAMPQWSIALIGGIGF